jgi:hypothetical protein
MCELHAWPHAPDFSVLEATFSGLVTVKEMMGKSGRDERT